jgi:hypothetical protein
MVSPTSAGLRAEVNPNGLATTYHFSYISETGYRANLNVGNDGFAGATKAPAGADPGIGSGVAVITAAQPIGSLALETAYRYRVQATNEAGTEIGAVHSFSTEGFAGPSPLLDGRAWEMVSPVDKNGGQIQGFGGSLYGGVLQAASSGGALTYSSTYSFGADAQGAPAASQYIGRRGGGGWLTENISVAGAAGEYGDEPDGVPYQLFSADLGRGLLLNGRACEVGESCPVGYSLRDGAGALTPSPEAPDLRFAGATPDLGKVALSTCAALTSNAIEAPASEGCDEAVPNLYVWSGGGITLVNLLPAAVQGTPGAKLASQARAISGDGSRVFWTLDGNLYLREGGTTKQVDQAIGGGGVFETASATGAVAFLTKEGHLYRYEAAAGTLTDLTPAGGTEGVLGASEDGAYLYYLSSAGLFLRHGASSTKIAAAADPSSYPAATGTARVTPDGAHLAFLSKAGLTGYDNRDASGQPQSEVFLYDALAANLICASCNPTGERPLGPSTISGASRNGKAADATYLYKPRNLSDDGRRLFFDSADALSLHDSGPAPAKRVDVYEWEAPGTGSCGRSGGCLGLVSQGRNGVGSTFVDASASGSDVFFLTADALVGADVGSAADLYDAREGGGFPEPIRPIECVGDACQSLPSEPDDPRPGTLTPSSPNPPPRFNKTSGCRPKFVKKRGRCVKKQRPLRKKQRAHGKKRTGARR